MRKVSYNVAGKPFASYTKAIAFKEQLENIYDMTFELETSIIEASEIDTEAKAKHRTKVSEILNSGYSIPM